jgi:GNAT superfamily N-acetyltransferase
MAVANTPPIPRVCSITMDGQGLTGTTVCRLATGAEQKALEALQWRASLNNPGDRAALLANPDAIELPLAQIDNGQVFVAERAGVMLGFAAVLPREDGQMELDALFVEPFAWKQGIGRILLTRCLDAVRASGARTLHVVGNPHAEGFYRACGFEHVGTSQTRFGSGLCFRITA